jgi:hypothetical protein
MDHIVNFYEINFNSKISDKPQNSSNQIWNDPQKITILINFPIKPISKSIKYRIKITPCVAFSHLIPKPKIYLK